LVLLSLMLFSMGRHVFDLRGHAQDRQRPAARGTVDRDCGARAQPYAESVSLWKALTQISALRGAQSSWHWFRATRRSELLVVVGEDVAATLGLSLALRAAFP
jgi:hypothetical protein